MLPAHTKQTRKGDTAAVWRPDVGPECGGGFDTPMEIGFGAPVSGSWATASNQVEIAQRAEALGYHSLWTFSRILYPDAPPDQRLAPPYRSVHDPLTVAAFLAGVTRRVRLGLAVVNLPFYPPLVLAKALTSIDIVSNGRLDAGLGLGWAAEEFAAAGVDMARRGERAEEFLACLRAIWAEGPVEFEGEFYRVPRGWVDPKPVQVPHPPILLGGTAEPALRRAGRLADGWISSSRFPGDQIPRAAAVIRDAAERSGRDPGTVRLIVRGSLRLRDQDNEDAPTMTGTTDKVRGDLAGYAAAGVDEVFLDLNFDEQIGAPDADPARSMEVAHQVLESFAPTAS